MLLSAICLNANEYGVGFFEENEAIYFAMTVKKVSNEHTARGHIFDGNQTFTGAILSSNDYEGEFGIFQFYRGREAYGRANNGI